MSDSAQGASPNSPRYFYIDSLAAAWMEEKFGMKFIFGDYYGKNDACTGGTPLEREFPSVAVYCLRDDNDAGKIYIHPDSLHLLRHRPNDVVVIDSPESLESTIVEIIPDSNELLSRHRTARIIQRNGIAFHWPECEAA